MFLTKSKVAPAGLLVASALGGVLVPGLGTLPQPLLAQPPVGQKEKPADKEPAKDANAGQPAETGFPTAGPAKLDLPAIVEGLRGTEKAWQSQESWLLRYQHTREFFISAEHMIEYQPREMTNARKGKWLLSHETTRGEMPDGKTVPVHSWYVGKEGEITWQVASGPRSQDPRGFVNMYSTFWYPENLWIPIWQDAVPSRKDLGLKENPLDFSLPRLLKEEGTTYVVRRQLEKIDGYPCHVIERKGKDVVWIDAARGFAVCRRTIYLPDGKLMSEWKATGLRERVKGIWLPEKQVLVNYHPDGSGKVFNVVSNALLEARFNDLPDELFAIGTPRERQKDKDEKEERAFKLLGIRVAP